MVDSDFMATEEIRWLMHQADAQLRAHTEDGAGRWDCHCVRPEQIVETVIRQNPEYFSNLPPGESSSVQLELERYTRKVLGGQPYI